MAADPNANDADSDQSVEIAADRPNPWMANVDWAGPGFMLNDMGPATVVLTEDDLQEQASALIVQRAVERSTQLGEEYEYDE